MPEVSAGALSRSLQAAVDAQGKVAQAAQDEAARAKAQRDAEPPDQAETDQDGGEAEE